MEDIWLSLHIILRHGGFDLRGLLHGIGLELLHGIFTFNRVAQLFFQCIMLVGCLGIMRDPAYGIRRSGKYVLVRRI